MEEYMLQNRTGYGKMLTVRDGFLRCPICCRSLKKIDNMMILKNDIAYCRKCKKEFRIDVVEGQCFQSQGR